MTVPPEERGKQMINSEWNHGRRLTIFYAGKPVFETTPNGIKWHVRNGWDRWWLFPYWCGQVVAWKVRRWRRRNTEPQPTPGRHG